MSRGGFSISAAHRGMPRRAMFLQHGQGHVTENTCVAELVSCNASPSLLHIALSDPTSVENLLERAAGSSPSDFTWQAIHKSVCFSEGYECAWLH